MSDTTPNACCKGSEIDLKEMRTPGQIDVGNALAKFLLGQQNQTATPFSGQLSRGNDPAQMAAMNTMMGIGGYGGYNPEPFPQQGFGGFGGTGFGGTSETIPGEHTEPLFGGPLFNETVPELPPQLSPTVDWRPLNDAVKEYGGADSRSFPINGSPVEAAIVPVASQSQNRMLPYNSYDPYRSR